MSSQWIIQKAVMTPLLLFDSSLCQTMKYFLKSGKQL